MPLNRVCVYAGSSSGNRPSYDRAAVDLADGIVEAGLSAVYGGGGAGLMGTLANRIMERGGQIIGVIPEALQEREIGNDHITELRVVGSMHERKALMAELADAFIALPGGIGTVEELVEALTWTQLGVHSKPCGLLNVEGYFDQLVAFLDRAVQEGFLDSAGRGALLVAERPDELLDGLRSFSPEPRRAWLDPREI